MVFLSHNQLTAVTAADLTCCSRLGHLDLRHNRLTRLSWAELTRALRGESLRLVYLSHNRWDCEHEEEAMEFWVR